MTARKTVFIKEIITAECGTATARTVSRVAVVAVIENPCGQKTRPHFRGELGMVQKHPDEASGAGVFGSTPTHRGSGQFVTSREIDRPR